MARPPPPEAMNAPPKPRPPEALVHRGTVLAAALLIDTALVGEREALRRIALAWAPGATVHRLGDALLIRLASPRWVDCARAPGLPLVAIVALDQGAPLDKASALTALPLAPDALAALAPLPPGAVVRMQGGALTVERLDDAAIEDPASYLDLSSLEIISVRSLGAPPPEASLVTAPRVEDTRALFGVAAPPDDLAGLLATMRASLAHAAPRSDGNSRGALAFVLARLGALLGSLAVLLAPVSAAPRAEGSGKSSSAEAPRGPGASRSRRALAQGPAAPSLADRIGVTLRRWLAAWLFRARLGPLIGRRQAAYVQRLVEMFERGDIDEALRHAIPLGGDGGLPAAPALSAPSPRSDLRIGLGAPRAASAILMDGDLFGALQQMYRAAFERLDGEGRVAEAAFVLVELLRAHEEAVAYLERHGRAEAAAELAEARGLPPGLVVRQWFVAGDRARAVQVARQFGAFADALVRLSDHPAAPELRRLWAESLARAGDHAAAVEVIWPISAERKQAAAWIEAALQQGGAASARMLVRKLELFPDLFPAVLAQVGALLADRAEGAAAERQAFAEALVRSAKAPASAAIARPTARALIADAARLGEPALSGLVQRLLTFAGDDALRADLPSWPAIARPSLLHIDAPRSIAIAASDTGAAAVLDAAHLPSGQTVLALGEAGVRVLRRRPADAPFHLDQPAHLLVPSDHGDRALALAYRGSALRVARLDLNGRRTEPWCEATLDAFAPDFDGSIWLVARGDRLFAIDAASPGFEALHALPLHRRPLYIARSPAGCFALVDDPSAEPGEDISRLHYELPAWTLRANKSTLRGYNRLHGATRLAAITGKSAAMLWKPQGRSGDLPLALLRARESGVERRREIGGEDDLPLALALRGGWVACAVKEKDAVTVRLLDEDSLTVRAVVTLGGASTACLRLGEATLTVGDDRGRLLVLDLAYGSLLRDARV